MKNWKKIFFIFSFFVAGLFLGGTAHASGLPAATIVYPAATTITVNQKPVITGLVASGTRALIYIDDVYNGKTEILGHPSGTANFAYKPFLSLYRGWHNLKVVAQDKNGNVSLAANVRFEIQYPMPAPTLFKPVINNRSTVKRPFIVGLAKNNSKILIYIDKKLSGQLVVKNHPSGTANFAFRPTQDLSLNKHKIYAFAKDSRGKISSTSNKVQYFLSVLQKRISQGVAETNKVPSQIVMPKFGNKEKKENIKNILPSKQIKTEKKDQLPNAGEKKIDQHALKIDVKKVVPEKKTETKKEKTYNEIKDILTPNQDKIKASGTGIVDENENNQSKFKLNLIIFILFLIGIILWIIWVNKELIKQKQKMQSDTTADMLPPLPPEEFSAPKESAKKKNKS